jgi:6-phosphogluconolactonase
MKTVNGLAAVAAGIGLILSAAGPAQASEPAGAVFAMTNNANANTVVAFARTAGGTLEDSHSFATGGRGSGGTVDPLASQGSLTLSEDRSLLFAANAGSGTVSVFRVAGQNLVLVDQVSTEGSEPVAIAQHGSLVYVVNEAASSSVVGFWLLDGKLTRIPQSLRFLSENGAGAASIAFSPDGTHLIVTERTSNLIDAFTVFPDGTLSAMTENPSIGPGAFAAIFAPDGAVLVSETGSSAPDSSAISSYALQSNNNLETNHLATISASVPTLGAANCWNAVTPDGRFVYASNSGSSSISGFAIGSKGALKALSGTIVGTNPPGATNLDIGISADGLFLYSLNAGTGDIGAFAINPTTGELTNLGTFGSLPASEGLNGIAVK